MSTRLERLNARARAGRVSAQCYYQLVLRQIERDQTRMAVELIAMNAQLKALLRRMRRER